MVRGVREQVENKFVAFRDPIGQGELPQQIHPAPPRGRPEDALFIGSLRLYDCLMTFGLNDQRKFRGVRRRKTQK